MPLVEGLSWLLSGLGVYTYREQSNLDYGYVGVVYFGRARPFDVKSPLSIVCDIGHGYQFNVPSTGSTTCSR